MFFKLIRKPLALLVLALVLFGSLMVILPSAYQTNQFSATPTTPNSNHAPDSNLTLASLNTDSSSKTASLASLAETNREAGEGALLYGGLTISLLLVIVWFRRRYGTI